MEMEPCPCMGFSNEVDRKLKSTLDWPYVNGLTFYLWYIFCSVYKFVIFALDFISLDLSMLKVLDFLLILFFFCYFCFILSLCTLNHPTLLHFSPHFFFLTILFFLIFLGVVWGHYFVISYQHSRFLSGTLNVAMKFEMHYVDHIFDHKNIFNGNFCLHVMSTQRKAS